MKILLLHLDGKLPNVALMRIARHHRDLGDDVELRMAANAGAIQPRFGDPTWDQVYASAIFEWTRPHAENVTRLYPRAIVGGTGVSLLSKLEDHGIATDGPLDYSVYPKFRRSIGFTQRGCRLRCEFCVVPKKEGKARSVGTVYQVWRGEPWPRELFLLDNDFFGQPEVEWRARIDEIRDGGFRVSFNQGINARFLNRDTATAIASVDYRDGDTMRNRRIYTAWDGRKDEKRLFRGLDELARAGVKPDHVMVYMLIGYEDGETHADRDHRRERLRAWGCRPYPMPYRRTRELVGYQRWVIGAYDKRIPWVRWEAADYNPRKLGDPHTGNLPGVE